MQMTQEELNAFLARPYIADLATVRADGSPHITPVWYLYDGSAFYITSRRGRAKVKHIERDPRVALSVHDTSYPYKGAMVEGVAEIIEANAAELTRKLAIHYLGPEEGRAYAEVLNRYQRIVISIRPKRVVSWDYSKTG